MHEGYARTSNKRNEKKTSLLTFPKISLMLLPDGDMTCFRSGDFIRGSGSSSRVAGLRQDNPPLLLEEEEVIMES